LINKLLSKKEKDTEAELSTNAFSIYINIYTYIQLNALSLDLRELKNRSIQPTENISNA